MTQDTRKDRRVKIVSLNVRYKSATVDEFIENHAHDVSRGGIYIKTANPFPAGTLLKFEIRLASDQAVIAGVGRVVWKRDAAHGQGERPAGMGVKFIKIDPPSAAVIDKLVNTRSDAGRSFEAEVDTTTDAPPPVLQQPPPAAKVPAAAAAVANMPVRKATMMGIGLASPAAGAPTPSTPPRPTPSTPPRPNPSAAPGPLFPKTSPEAEQPAKQEQTVMKQAAELLEEALREAGGSMEDVGTNPLFSGGAAPAAAAKAPTEEPASATPEDEAAKARALVAGLTPAPAPEKKGPSEPPRTTRDTPVAKVSERPKPAARQSSRPPAPYVSRASDAPPPKKSGSGGTVMILLGFAAVAAAVVMYKDKIFGGSVPEAEPSSTTVHAADTASAPAASASTSAAPSAGSEAPAASASAQAAPDTSASATPPVADAAPQASASAAPAHAAPAAPPPAAPPPPRPAPPPAAAAAAPASTPAATAAPTAAPKPPPAAPKPKPKAADEDNPY
jgi:uncharacterized protein (TIGR02266 family)